MNRIEFGDCRDIMRRWASEGVKAQTCSTSPPYFGLRDYGAPGQIGLENTPEEYVANMVEVFSNVRDMLADDGTLWLNIGDTYAGYHGNKNAAYDAAPSNKRGYFENQRKTLVNHNGIKNKDLIGIPWMLALALRQDGWYLRQDLIWHKPNPTPESVTDRCTKSHEYIFLFSKSPKYFFDHVAIQEDAVRGHAGSDFRKGKTATHLLNRAGAGERVDTGKRNRRSVWTVPTKPYRGAHFATFPTDLIEPCVLASTSAEGHCAECGARWRRQTSRVDRGWDGSRYGTRAVDASGGALSGGTARSTLGSSGGALTGSLRTDGWQPGCDCRGGVVPDVVLDPFMGSGTTALVAQTHGRHYLGCEINADYRELQEKRLADGA